MAKSGKKMIASYCKNKNVLNSSKDALSCLNLSYSSLSFLISIPKYSGAYSAAAEPQTCIMLYIYDLRYAFF